MPDFFTDKQGRVRPIRGGKGGGFIAAAAVGLTISVASGGVGGAGAIDSAASRSLHVQTTSGKNAARRGHRDEAWRRMKLKRLKRAVERDLRCATHSFGQVRSFFLHVPCRSLRRALLVLGDGDGAIVVALAWVRMPSAARAKRFKKLEDTYGTGDISPIAGEVLALGGMRFTGTHYSSRRSGSLTVIAETEPLAAIRLPTYSRPSRRLRHNFHRRDRWLTRMEPCASGVRPWSTQPRRPRIRWGR